MILNILDIPVLYINLDSAKEERARIEKMLTDAGFKDIRRIRGVQNKVKKTGVAYAHKRALIAALEIEGPFIILENDVIIHNFKKKIEVPDDADAYYLGVSRWGLHHGKGIQKISAARYDIDTFRLYNMLSAHAILYLNKDYVKFLLRSVEFYLKLGTNQDKGRAETMKYWNIYAERIPIFAQSGKYYEHTAFSLPGPACLPPSRVWLS